MARHIHRLPNTILDRTMISQFRLITTYQSQTAEGKPIEMRERPSDVRWGFSFSARTVRERVWAKLEAFYNKVMLNNDYFMAYDLIHSYPRGRPQERFNEDVFSDGTRFTDGYGFASTGLTPVTVLNPADVNDAGYDELSVQNLLPNTRVFVENDHISIDYDGIPILHSVVNDAYSDNDGRALLKLSPRIYKKTFSGQVVNVVRPMTVFQFESATVSRKPPVNADISIKATAVPEVLWMPGITVDP